MDKVLIADLCDTGSEREAVRQTLEYFGYTVLVKLIGRPKDLIDVLQGDLIFDADIVIISCHGDGGKIKMPVLREDIYFADEPRSDFGPEEIEKYCRITGKTIICTGCTTGCEKTAGAFAKDNAYLAPADDIDGNAGLMFVIRLFYELTNGKDLSEAYEAAKEMDSETRLYLLYKPIRADRKQGKP